MSRIIAPMVRASSGTAGDADELWQTLIAIATDVRLRKARRPL